MLSFQSPPWPYTMTASLKSSAVSQLLPDINAGYCFWGLGSRTSQYREDVIYSPDTWDSRRIRVRCWQCDQRIPESAFIQHEISSTYYSFLTALFYDLVRVTQGIFKKSSLVGISVVAS